MRALMSLFTAIAVIGLGFWAYQQNILTQQAEREVARLEAEIAAHHERLAILRSEWAFLNRPDRLRALVDMNFDRLGCCRCSQISLPPFMKCLSLILWPR